MPEYGVCFPPALLEGVICKCFQEVSALQGAPGKAEFAVIPVRSRLFKSMDFQAWLLLTWERGVGGRKEVMQNTCSAASATDEGGFDFGCREAESELSC